MYINEEHFDVFLSLINFQDSKKYGHIYGVQMVAKNIIIPYHSLNHSRSSQFTKCYLPSCLFFSFLSLFYGVLAMCQALPLPFHSLSHLIFLTIL